MQLASSRIWTRVAVSISYDDNLYTTLSFFICICPTPSHVKFNRFEFRISLLLDWFPYEGLRAQSALLLTHSMGSNSLMNTYPKCIRELPRPRFDLTSLNSFPTMITNIPRASLLYFYQFFVCFVFDSCFCFGCGWVCVWFFFLVFFFVLFCFLPLYCFK